MSSAAFEVLILCFKCVNDLKHRFVKMSRRRLRTMSHSLRFSWRYFIRWYVAINLSLNSSSVKIFLKMRFMLILAFNLDFNQKVFTVKVAACFTYLILRSDIFFNPNLRRNLLMTIFNALQIIPAAIRFLITTLIFFKTFRSKMCAIWALTLLSIYFKSTYRFITCVRCFRKSSHRLKLLLAKLWLLFAFSISDFLLRTVSYFTFYCLYMRNLRNFDSTSYYDTFSTLIYSI